MRYVLDSSRSRFTVQAFATGMLSGFAHSPTFAVREFTGELRFDADALADTSFQLTARADSLTLLDSVKPQDREEIESRMRQEVLETARYPEITFRSTSITADRITGGWYRLQIAGDLHLHGVKKAHRVDTQLRVTDDESRLSGQYKLSQSGHGIKLVSALGGMIRVKDELKIDFDFVGRKESPDPAPGQSPEMVGLWHDSFEQGHGK
jgi:polyisoprenoid-binding protein YceI